MWLNTSARNIHTCRYTFQLLCLTTIIFSCLSAPSASHANKPNIPLLAEIIIEGNERTDRDLILKEMGLEFGHPFSKQDMDKVWDTLEDIGYFAFVDMEYDDSEGEKVTLRVFLEEDMTTHYSPSILYSRRFKYELGAWIEESNFRGKGETLHFEAFAYQRLRGRLSWTKPWLWGAKGLESTISLGGEKANFVFRPTDYAKYDADLQVRKKFASGLFTLAGLNQSAFDQKDSYNWLLPDRGDEAAPASATYGAQYLNLTAWRAALGIDTRSNPYYPKQGIFAQAMVTHWTGSGLESYTETSLDGRFFIPVMWGHTLALRGWGRTTDNPTHLDNMLFLGGPGTIRGQPFALLEGEEGYLLTAEYRIPLFMMPISPRGEMVGAGIHLFYDSGDAWFEGADPGRALQSYGAGIHLNMDKQQFRFEAAKAEDGDWSFEFLDHFNF
jgi:outer membrane protein assembly factor BamA